MWWLGKNYVVYSYFKLNSLAYVDNDQTFNTTIHFAYSGPDLPGAPVLAQMLIRHAVPGGREVAEIANP